ncbi:hypothetical protein LCGC14_1972610 [marine sediment metagenome]|uniref:Uncharacterized protein n=1 Tax=marine sediment metagenome TaxID=412755 RepID=A0A0F9HPN1_9ZZZZ
MSLMSEYKKLKDENARLQERVEEAKRAMKKPGWENHLEMRRYKTLAERRKQAMVGLMKDMHTGTSMQNRGSLGPGGLGCGRPCLTCDTARAAIDATPEEAREKERQR